MRPIQHPSNNDILRAPPDMTPDQCVDLHITRGQYGDGTPAVISYWQPNETEKAAIARGMAIRFEAIGFTHPPIIIGVDGVDQMAQEFPL